MQQNYEVGNFPVSESPVIQIKLAAFSFLVLVT